MKNPEKSHLRAVQSVSRGKEHPKTYSNLRKNSSIYFQVGLIIALLFVHLVFEMQFEKKRYVIPALDPIEDDSPKFFSQNFVIEKAEETKKEVGRKKVNTISTTFKSVPNEEILPKELEFSSKNETPDIIDPGSITVIEKPDDFNPNEIFDITRLEQVPIFPGCEKEKTNKEKIKCMSEKLSRIVQKNFDTSIGSSYGLSGTQRISMAFTINKDGEIVDVKARAPHDILEKEAIRVAQKIPKMTPGKQRFQPVSVAYYLPIVFTVQD